MWKMNLEECQVKFNQVVTPVAATMLHRVLLLEQITIFFGYAAITLGHCIETLR